MAIAGFRFIVLSLFSILLYSSDNASTPRNEILHNIDPVWMRKGQNSSHPGDYDVTVRAAIRVGDWKLLTGDPGQRKLTQLTFTGVFIFK